MPLKMHNVQNSYTLQNCGIPQGLNKKSALEISCVIKSPGKLPTQQTVGSSGWDLSAAEKTLIEPWSAATVSTGVFLAIPFGYEAQVRSRSGLAYKHNVVILQGIGTIDADYRGEVLVMLMNLSSEPFIVEQGMRIAQLVICAVPSVVYKQVEALDSTLRGTGGFGSTGF